MKVFILMTIISCFVLSCSQDRDYKFVEDIGDLKPNASEMNEHLDLISIENQHSKIIKGIKYSFYPIGALDFLERNGKTPDAEDLEQLKNETVVIFEIEDTNSFHNIFENKLMTMNKDALIQYLTGVVINDIIIKQNGKNFVASGSQYEGAIGANSNKLRVLTYFSGINLKEDYSIQFNDPIFESGIIKLSKKTKQLPV